MSEDFWQKCERIFDNNFLICYTLLLFPYSTISWEKGGEIIDAIEKCITLMETCDLTTNYWDLIVLSMDSWASSCLHHARQMISQYQVSFFSFL